jgi:uncharacterized membrane protein (UPF0127 family)
VIKAFRLMSFALVLALVGCEEQQQGTTQPSTLPTVPMKIGSRDFELEVARTAEEQERGLMKRDSMPQNHGMIFVFPDEHLLSFWMKDTRFPLDILFLDRKGKVVSIFRMKPYDLSNTSSEKPAQYAIELNAGAAKDAGVKVGDVLDIPAAAQAKQ